MSDAFPPNLPPATPAHPGPPTGWRPMSGLAVTSFVLSLLFILLAVPGLWISELIPLGLGILTLATVKVTARRGRVLAVWAIVIAVGVGSCSYVLHSGVRSALGEMAESLLSALAAEESDEDIDKALKPWMNKERLEADPELLAAIRARYRKVEEAFGAYRGRVDLGSPYLGFAPLFFEPEGLVEVGSAEKTPGWKPGTAIWVKAEFERGHVHVAIRIGTDDEEGMQGITDAQSGDQVPIVGDVRFFRPGTPAATDAE